MFHVQVGNKSLDEVRTQYHVNGMNAINRVMRSQVEKYYLVDFTREALFGSSKAHSG